MAEDQADTNCADCMTDDTAPPKAAVAREAQSDMKQARSADLSADTNTVALPRIVITYCTQCRWMLRAAYFAQELLSTFGTAIGEIALRPATGGVFVVTMTYQPPQASSQGDSDVSGAAPKSTTLWDRKADGGFPETKVLKQRVRDCIEPEKDLGHSDNGGHRSRGEINAAKNDR